MSLARKRKTYDLVYADPPWWYGKQMLPGGSKSLDHYPSMRPEELRELPVQRIVGDNALLFLWTTGPKLAEAVELGQAWGFKFITVVFVWDKKGPVYGQYTMSDCEFVLLFRKGKVPVPFGRRGQRQLVSLRKGRHSAKPGEIREAIEALFPTARRIELFARDRRKGWDVWGNEV